MEERDDFDGNDPWSSSWSEIGSIALVVELGRKKSVTGHGGIYLELKIRSASADNDRNWLSMRNFLTAVGL